MNFFIPKELAGSFSLMVILVVLNFNELSFLFRLYLYKSHLFN